MNTSDLYASNIQNLTDLWKAMGVLSSESNVGPDLHASESWPHRLWFDVGAQPARADAVRLIEAARGASRPVILPVWCRDELSQPEQARSTNDPRSTEELRLAKELSAAGYEVLFEQTVMALDLEQWSSKATAAAGIELHRVGCETSTWAEVASKSFGYTVESQITDRIVRTPGVSLLTAEKNGRSVGTGLLYAEGETAGIHLVGVPPEFRRMGIARKIMLHVLDDARSRGLRYATLQASAMGEGLYRELGFGSQGWIRNFSRPRPAQRVLSPGGTAARAVS